MRELNLELLLFRCHRQVADGTGRTDTVASPRAIWRAARELTVADNDLAFSRSNDSSGIARASMRTFGARHNREAR
jgi:hypothetical protein